MKGQHLRKVKKQVLWTSRQEHFWQWNHQVQRSRTRKYLASLSENKEVFVAGSQWASRRSVGDEVGEAVGVWAHRPRYAVVKVLALSITMQR